MEALPSQSSHCSAVIFLFVPLFLVKQIRIYQFVPLNYPFAQIWPVVPRLFLRMFPSEYHLFPKTSGKASWLQSYDVQPESRGEQDNVLCGKRDYPFLSKIDVWFRKIVEYFTEIIIAIRSSSWRMRTRQWKWTKVYGNDTCGWKNETKFKEMRQGSWRWDMSQNHWRNKE